MSLESVAVFPGTFDPVTFGHIDIVRRASRLVNRLVIGVANNERKKPLFKAEDRVLMLKDVINIYGCGTNIEIRTFDGLLVDFMRLVGAKVSIRGLRVATDFSYEFQMSCINRKLDSEVDTLFLAATEENQFVSSSFAKEIARLGGDVSSFLPEKVSKLLKERIQSSKV